MSIIENSEKSLSCRPHKTPSRAMRLRPLLHCFFTLGSVTFLQFAFCDFFGGEWNRQSLGLEGENMKKTLRTTGLVVTNLLADGLFFVGILLALRTAETHVMPLTTVWL